jgi:hypothetical protein
MANLSTQPLPRSLTHRANVAKRAGPPVRGLKSTAGLFTLVCEEPRSFPFMSSSVERDAWMVWAPVTTHLKEKP